MAVENRGIDIKFEGDTALRFTCAVVDQWAEPPDAVTTGTMQVRLFHQTPGTGRWEIYNWSTNVFEDPANATGANYYTTAANIAAGSATPYATAIWEKRLTVLTDFEAGHQFYVEMVHSTQGRFYSYFQYGPPPQEGQWYAAGALTVYLDLTLTDGTTPCPQVVGLVRTTLGVLQASFLTNAAGRATVNLDAGTYILTYGPDSRYSLSNPYVLVVAANGEVHPYTCTATIYPDQGMTFGEMVGHVLNTLAEYASGASGDQYRTLTEDMVKTWVRQGHYKLDAMLRWTRNVDTIHSVATQADYTYDVDVQEIEFVTYDGKELERTTLPELLNKRQASATAGDPTYWAWWGGTLYFYPTPETTDDHICLYAVKVPLALVDETEIPSLPPQDHSLIVTFALTQAYKHVGNIENTAACQAMFDVQAQEARLRLYSDRGTNRRVRTDGV